MLIMDWKWTSAVLAALSVSPAAAQLSGWANNQINASICTWAQPRGTLCWLYRLNTFANAQQLLSFATLCILMEVN